MILKNDQTNSNWKGVWYSSSDNTLKQGKFKDQKKVAVSLQEVWDGGEPEMMLEKVSNKKLMMGLLPIKERILYS